MRQRFWELGGTKMGASMGVKDTEKEKEEEEKKKGKEETDFSKDSKFAEHMKKKQEAVSEFAQTKTIKQQREVCEWIIYM